MLAYRGTTFPELDVDAVIVTGADLVLVDELAHSSPDGSRRRWEDVAEIRAAGLDVLTTTNVANLHSVRDYAARLTGAGMVESVPDEFVRSGEVVLVDLPSEALRQRIASGRVFSADRLGGALADYFRVSNLEALRELARAWMADRVATVGDELLARRGLADLTGWRTAEDRFWTDTALRPPSWGGCTPRSTGMPRRPRLGRVAPSSAPPRHNDRPGPP